MTRKEPAIFNASGVLGLGPAIAVTLIYLAILFGLVFLINHSDRNDLTDSFQDPRTWVPIFLVSLGFIVFPVVMVVIGLRSIFQYLSINLEKRRWISGAHSLQVPITARSREYDEYAEVKEQEWHCTLTIRMPVLTENGIEEQEIPVSVNDRTYSAHLNKDVVKIFYDPDDPLMFVFEGE